MHATLKRRPSPSVLAPPRVTATRAAWTAAALSLAAAWVHLAYMGSHFREWWAYGAFFLGSAVAQAALAVLVLVRPAVVVLLGGIALNVGIVGMYVLSRTQGPPLGPHAHVAEVAGPIDLATTAAEILLVGVLLTMLRGWPRRVVLDLLLLAGAALWALRLTGHLA
jgi:hypothetical protein